MTKLPRAVITDYAALRASSAIFHLRRDISADARCVGWRRATRRPVASESRRRATEHRMPIRSPIFWRRAATGLPRPRILFYFAPTSALQHANVCANAYAARLPLFAI